MTTFRPKLWTSAGAALLLGLSACGEGGAEDTDAAAPDAPAATSGERGEGGATAQDRRADGQLEDANGRSGDTGSTSAPAGEGGEGGGEGGERGGGNSGPG